MRLEREAAARLTANVSVSDAGIGVPEYLARKKLCRIKGSQDRESELRYPAIEVIENPDGSYELTADSIAASIEWQDAQLSAPEVISKVGAITFRARSGSKTGLSHICDWAQLLALLDANGQLTPIGRLLVALSYSRSPWNPYVLGSERIVIAYQLFQQDIDLLREFLPLAVRNERSTKSDARDLFVDALVRVCNALQADSSGPTSARFAVFQQLRDLERSAKKAKKDLKQTSTAWHRTASRVETLVDVGLFAKKTGEEQFQYVYRPTEKLSTATLRFAQTSPATEWIDLNVVDIVFAELERESTEPVTPEEVEVVARMLSLPTTMLPIECLKLGIAAQRAAAGVRSSLAHIRRDLETLPVRFPASARLTRGSVGARAEFLSWRYRST
jgi:hypothetical protein